MSDENKKEKYSTIISLVGGQISPVVIPFFQFNFDCGILIGTEATMDECERISRILQKRFHKRIEIVSTLPYTFNFDELWESLKKVGLNYNQTVFINITGGTKPMAIKMYEWAKRFGGVVGYVSSEEKNITLIKKNITEVIDIEAKINIEEYLALHGCEILGFDKKKQAENNFYNAISNGTIMDNHFKFKIEHTDYNKKLLSNKFGSHIKKEINSGEIEVFVPLEPNEIYKFNELADGGFWLENFLYLQLKGMEYFDDIYKQVKIEKDKRVYEIDIIFIKNFIPGIISCKVKKQAEGKTSEFNSYVNELISYIELFGRYTRTFLITTFELTSQFKLKSYKQGVLVFDIRDLKNFNNVKKEIIEKMQEKIPAT